MPRPSRRAGSVFGRLPSGARLERVHASPRFKDGIFRNSRPVAPGLKPGAGFSTMAELVLGKQQRIPKGPLPSESPLEAWGRPVETGLRATWLGHSTVLLEIDGFRVLTDPVWGERASPLRRMGPKRFQPVPVSVAQLPPLDAVVISHDHYDHLDWPTVLELGK
ncbi:MAG TPA: MBL fold metallo-hydrolase, partial [Myxococcales bacterium]|nr:MBL fold metallo-hydrolase [Myxococcales bacterium]